MKRYMIQSAKVTAVLTFLLGISMLSLRVFSGQSEQRGAFVLVSNHHRNENELPKSVYKITVTVVYPALGRFKITSYDLLTGKTHITFGDPVGFYDVIDDALQYVESSDHIKEFDSRSFDTYFFQSNKLFAREEEVANVKTFVFHSDIGDRWIETYYSPLIGFFPLKVVTFDKKSNVKDIEEVVSVQFRNLAPHEYMPPNLPVRFDRAEGWIIALRSSNNPVNHSEAQHKSNRLEEARRKLGANK
jgi:hypothetical protein